MNSRLDGLSYFRRHAYKAGRGIYKLNLRKEE